ncbi:hypothetical protein X975_10781, partial [Stegodyphus mimosarum]
MRYDTKKPGPTYMLHEDEDGDTSNDMTEQDINAYIARLSKASSEKQLLSVLRPPVGEQKSSKMSLPSR